MSVETKLLSSCAYGNISSVKLLTEVIKCDPNTVREISQGETPLHVACENGNIDIVKYLISTHNCNPQCANFSWALLHSGYTPLHNACQNGHLDIAKYLITECGCNPECFSSDGLTPLNAACLNGQLDIAKYLISQWSCNPQCPSNNSVTALYAACQNGHLDIVRYLVTQCHCNPQCPTIDGKIPLHAACLNGHLDIASYLISRCNCNPRYTNNDGLTPLHAACQNSHLDIVRYLISQCSCDPLYHGNDGATPLHLACRNGHLEIARYLIDQCSCSPQCLNNDGMTPLHVACENGHLHVASYLISQSSCNPQYHSNDGVTPLELACQNGHLDIARYLITECSCNPQHLSNSGRTSLHAACLNGQLDLAKYLITQCGCNPQCPNNDGWTPLHAACLNGQLDIARYLITQCGCNPQCYTSNGLTPLYAACQNGHLDIAKYLFFQCSCNPQYPSNDGLTPLHAACLNGQLEMASYLISQCKCKPECPTNDGMTPLHIACQNGHLDLIRYLIHQYNCNPECPSNNGLTPLHVACQCGQLDVAKNLITQYNSNAQCPNINGITPLHAACSHGQIDIAKYLISECDSDPERPSINGVTPLHCACYSGHLDIVKYLVTQCKSNPECKSSKGHTPLHAACENGYLHITKYLITQCSCNPQCINNDDGTPLHSACQFGHLDIARYLISQCNCNPGCSSFNGYTPLHAACENGYLDIVRYLILECRCDPNRSEHIGTTPLHYSCSAGHEEIVRFLLSTGSCNPLQSNVFGNTAFSFAKSLKIKDVLKSYYNSVIKYPIESYIKIFTVGDVCVGKSTLVKSLQQNPGVFSSFFGQIFEQHVSGVSAATAGIETFPFNSKEFGNVVIYDFAGDYEYYTSQAAFLQSFTSQIAGLFLIVVNLKQPKDKVMESLNYWMSFIQECWGHNKTDAHVIVVGSHADQVEHINKFAAFEEVLSLPLCGVKSGGAVCLDCRKPSSPQLGQLHTLLDTACTTLRNESGKIDGRCYVLYEHLQTYYTKRGLPACTLKSLSGNIKPEDHPLLPHTPNELLLLLKALHDKGQIILLETENQQSSWVICQKAILLQEIVGKVFAPPRFKSYVNNFSSTGIVSHSTVQEVFPHLNSDLIIDFMKHFEFCHSIDNPNTLIDHCRTGGRCYLFPALIRLERPSTIWKDSKINKLSHDCGWYIKCLKAPGKPQFFNSRFLHVLLLRLAFQFALPPDASEHSSDLALERRCKMWKNGIFWCGRAGATIHFELTQHSQTAILLMGCLKECEMEYIKLRSQIIQTILRAKDDMCPLTSVKEGMFADPLKLMKYVNQPHFLLEKMDTYSLTEISTAISQSEPAVVGCRSANNIQLSVLLYFEPYAALSKDIEFISKSLFIESLEEEAMSDRPVFEKVTEEFLARVAKCACTSHKDFAVVFKLNEVVKVTETDSDFRKCLQILRSWKDSMASKATYENFRQTLDSYSIFCGRNPLVSSHVNSCLKNCIIIILTIFW